MIVDGLASAFDSLVRETQARRLPGVSAAVRVGSAQWEVAYGLADADAAALATPATVYRFASVTKTLTAAALMQLRDAGALDLDDRLERHLGASGPVGRTTLRQLLAHIAGIQRELPDVWETHVFPDSDGLLARLPHLDQVLQPSTSWHYSNVGYGLLGVVIERCSGLPATRYISERVLDPLELTRTSWRRQPPAATGYFVSAYSDAVRAAADVDMGALAPAGQLWGTAADLARWGAFLADPDAAVLAPASAAEMRSPVVMVDLDQWRVAWGLGLMLFRHDTGVIAGHEGGIDGFTAGLALSPKYKVAAAALTNASTTVDLMGLALRLVAKAVEHSAPASEPWYPTQPPPAELTTVLGRWWSQGFEFVFRYRDGRLAANLAHLPADAEPAIFEAVGPDRFRVMSGRELGESLEVVRDDGGQAIKLYWAGEAFVREPPV